MCGCFAAADVNAVPSSHSSSSSSSAATSISEHRLFINCTACGRIHCEKEGEGPCFFCGSYVSLNGTQPNPDFLVPHAPGGSQMELMNEEGMLCKLMLFSCVFQNLIILM
jgi:hypothetical protein